MTNYSVEWTEKAYFSLRQIHSFIALQSPKGAKKIVRELISGSEKLSSMPKRNPIEPNLRDAPNEYRFLVKWNYKIIFTILEKDKKVLVVLVFDTRQDVQKLQI
jgi:plasmid stabilization system protein ParE